MWGCVPCKCLFHLTVVLTLEYIYRGFALERMITILTPRFIAFFLILWIICENIIHFHILSLTSLYDQQPMCLWLCYQSRPWQAFSDMDMWHLSSTFLRPYGRLYLAPRIMVCIYKPNYCLSIADEICSGSELWHPSGT
jgi:hypothetical protein